MSNNSCRIPRYATYPDCSGAKEKQQTSDLELRIRKEVVASVEELVIEVTNHYAIDRAQVLVKVIQDRLNLLWNEQ